MYADRCEACHGAYGAPTNDPTPSGKTPRDLASPAFQQSTSDAELKQAVRHGHHYMPALVPSSFAGRFFVVSSASARG